MRLPPTAKSTFFRGLRFSRPREAPHASLIHSWHNDRASRVVESESSSILQPATTRILPRRPAFFMKFPVTYECPNELARLRMEYELFHLFAYNQVSRYQPFDVFLIYMKASINF